LREAAASYLAKSFIGVALRKGFGRAGHQHRRCADATLLAAEVVMYSKTEFRCYMRSFGLLGIAAEIAPKP